MQLNTGHPVIRFDRIDSTNAEARRRAEAGGRGPLWLWADEQTGGRGRLGRRWVSEPGNLYATFLFSISTVAAMAAQVSFVAALAVHDMVTALLQDANPRIKWPNDVLIAGAKFCGVLPEVVGANPTRIAIGCGVNVAHAPEGTPYPVTCLSSPPPCGGELAGAAKRQAGLGVGVALTPEFGVPPPRPLPTRGRAITVEDVLQQLDANLSQRLAIWNEGQGFAAIREAWEARALGLGAKVTATSGTKDVHGTFSGLAADGALLLTGAGGAVTHIHSGEVKFAELEAMRNRTR